MTREEFQDLVVKLKKGDNSPLARVQLYQSVCIGMLIKKSNYTCHAEMGYDIFIDSVLDFRSNVLNDKVEYENIQAYLKRICWNKWLAASRQRIRIQKKKESVERSLYNPYVEVEISEEAKVLRNNRLTAINESMKMLSTRCRQILQMAIVDKLSMQEIALEFNFASPHVAKTTKSRCYKKLLEHIRN